MRQGSSRDVQAVTHNQQVARLLTKTNHTLELEETYALKLIQLDQREIKIRQKWLKHRVAKIKSHLTLDEISDLRELELDGKLTPYHGGPNLNTAIRIAAAAKRLKLGVEPSQGQKKRAQSAHPALYARPQRQPISTGTDVATNSETRRRPNSVAGAFVDAPAIAEDLPRRRASQEVGLQQQHSTITFEPKTTPLPKDDGEFKGKPSYRRPATSHELDRDRPTKPTLVTRSSRPKTAVGVGYSCHTNYDPDQNHASPRERKNSSPRRGSFLSDGSLGSKIAKCRAQELRQVLLDAEQVRTEELEVKRQDFLVKASTWVQENPSTQADLSKAAETLEEVASAGSGGTQRQTASSATTRQRQRQARSSSIAQTAPTAVAFMNQAFHKRQEVSDDERRQPVSLTDMKKCRYLRIDPDQVDLSGINTLVTSQFKLYGFLRRPDETGGKNGGPSTVRTPSATPLTGASP